MTQWRKVLITKALRRAYDFGVESFSRKTRAPVAFRRHRVVHSSRRSRGVSHGSSTVVGNADAVDNLLIDVQQFDLACRLRSDCYACKARHQDDKLRESHFVYTQRKGVVKCLRITDVV